MYLNKNDLNNKKTILFFFIFFLRRLSDKILKSKWLKIPKSEEQNP